MIRALPLRVSLADVVIVVTAVALGLASLVIVVDSDLKLAVVAPGLDLVINTVTTLVAASVAVLAFARFEETNSRTHAYQAAAFGVLAAAGGVFVAAVLVGGEAELGLMLDHPTQVPLWIWTVARLMAGVLFLMAARPGWIPAGIGRAGGGFIVAVSLAVLGVAVAVTAVLGPLLPPLVSAEGLDALSRQPAFPSAVDGVTPIGAVLQLLAAGLLAAAAVSYRRRHTGGRRVAPDVQSTILALALVVAAYSQVLFALHPGTYTSLVTVGDLLRLAFYGLVLVAVEAETRADLRALRSAHAELGRMRETEVARATLEERGRLAREIHDGLAQDLWYAKLKLGRLRAATALDGEERRLMDDVVGAIDAGLSDARQAVMAMRASLSEATFGEVLRVVRRGFRGPVRVPGALPRARRGPAPCPAGAGRAAAGGPGGPEQRAQARRRDGSDGGVRGGGRSVPADGQRQRPGVRPGWTTDRLRARGDA